MILILLGPPGAGKGTHGQIVAGRLGLRAVSTGEVLREEIEAGTPLGLRARTFIEKGNLVPDEVETRGPGKRGVVHHRRHEGLHGVRRFPERTHCGNLHGRSRGDCAAPGWT